MSHRGKVLADLEVEELQLLSLDDKVLASLVREYIGESSHGSWEGFKHPDLKGVLALLTDMNLYYKSSGDHFHPSKS